MWQAFLFSGYLSRIAWGFGCCVNLSITTNHDFTINSHTINDFTINTITIACRRWGILSKGCVRKSWYRAWTVEYIWVDIFFVEIQFWGIAIYRLYILKCFILLLLKGLIICSLFTASQHKRKWIYPHWSASSQHWASSSGHIQSQEHPRRVTHLKGIMSYKVNVNEAEPAGKPVHDFNKKSWDLKGDSIRAQEWLSQI